MYVNKTIPNKVCKLKNVNLKKKKFRIIFTYIKKFLSIATVLIFNGLVIHDHMIRESLIMIVSVNINK